MVLETSVVSTFNHLTRLEARENFINLSRRESLKSKTHDVSESGVCLRCQVKDTYSVGPNRYS
jgi:hypothetical protein